MLLIIIWAFFIAVIAYIYREYLAHQKVLNWWFQFGLRFEKKWFYDPIWGCQMCFAGQMALWIYFFNAISSNLNENAPFWRFVFFFIPKYGLEDYDVITGVFSITLSILLTLILTKLIKQIEKWN